MTDSFLVYDGRNRAFRAGARRAARLSDQTTLVPWRAENTRRFFEAQFGDHLFAFVLIDPKTDRVHAGGETVRRLLRNRGVPQAIADAAERGYAVASDPLGRVLHGRSPADIDGTYPIVESARPHVESIRRECSVASCDT